MRIMQEGLHLFPKKTSNSVFCNLRLMQISLRDVLLGKQSVSESQTILMFGLHILHLWWAFSNCEHRVMHWTHVKKIQSCNKGCSEELTWILWLISRIEEDCIAVIEYLPPSLETGLSPSCRPPCPAHSPHLSSLNRFLWMYLKDRSKLITRKANDALKNNILMEIRRIHHEILDRVVTNSMCE